MSRVAAAVVLASGALLAVAACASAQPVSGGLVDAVGPVGFHRVEVRAPDDVRLPVRLVYASEAQGTAEVWIDVLVARSEAEALGRGQALAGEVAAGLAPLPGLGSRAWGDRGMVVLVRGVFVASVRVMRGGHDAIEMARGLDGHFAVAEPDPSWAPTMQIAAAAQGAPRSVAFEGGVVAAHVVATGDAYARRSPRGWVIVRSGPGPVTVRALVVGPDLRVRELARSLP